MDDKYVQRVGAPPIRVAIVSDHREGNLDDAVPSIIVEVMHSTLEPFFLTWKEARELVEAIQHVEGVARNG